VVGQVDQIAPTEDIRSVRFMGEKGYEAPALSG